MLNEHDLFGSAKRLAAAYSVQMVWMEHFFFFYAAALQGLGLRAGSKSVTGDGNKQPYPSLLEANVLRFSKCEFAVPLPALLWHAAISSRAHALVGMG